MSRKNRLFAKLANTVNSNGRLQESSLAADIELGGGGVGTYATPSDLPLVGNEAGDQAFVSSTNRLYIFNGSGWFNIALINTSPTITQGSEASYQLQKNGTPTVITLVATDPEETPIIWSYAVTSGVVGNTATINQVDNVITITPSTDENNGGEFTLTFTASDGVNIDTSTSSFSLSFAWEINVADLNGTWNNTRLTWSSNQFSDNPNNIYGISLASNGIDVYGVGSGTGTDATKRIRQWSSNNTTEIDNDTINYKIVATANNATKIDCHISSDGVYFFWLETGNFWERYTLTTPFDITTLDESTRVTHSINELSSSTSAFWKFTISDNGMVLYALTTYSSERFLKQYNLTSPWDITTASTATRVANIDLTLLHNRGSGVRGIAVDPTGSNFYLLETTKLYSNQYNLWSHSLHQYAMNPSYNIATWSYVAEKVYSQSGSGEMGPLDNKTANSLSMNAGNIAISSNDSRRIVQLY